MSEAASLLKHREWWQDRHWSLYRDNAPVHTALSVQIFLAITKMAVVPHPPCSPDMSHLFLWTRLRLLGRRFQVVSEILTFRRVIQTSQFRLYFRQWRKRRTCCINQDVYRFELNGIDQQRIHVGVSLSSQSNNSLIIRHILTGKGLETTA